MPGMTKAKVRTIEKMRARRNGIIIVKGINIKTLLKMGRGCQMKVIFRCQLESEIFRNISLKS